MTQVEMKNLYSTTLTSLSPSIVDNGCKGRQVLEWKETTHRKAQRKTAPTIWKDDLIKVARSRSLRPMVSSGHLMAETIIMKMILRSPDANRREDVNNTSKQ